MPRDGTKNLRPPTSEEARERGRKGGKASVEARRQRKTLKEELMLLLENEDTQEKLCNALVMQARRGSIKAFEVIRDTVGEKPVDKVESELKGNMTIKFEGELDKWSR